MGSSYEPHGLFRGHRAGPTPGHDDLPPAPPEEAELSKHLSQDVAQPIRDRVRFAVDPSAQLQCTPSSPSARPALALKGCGDAPAPIQSSDFRHMLLSLMEACDYHGGSTHVLDFMTVRLSIARKLRLAGHAAAADRITYSIENYDLNLNLVNDSGRVGLSQSLRAFQSSESLPLCPACEAACSKVTSFSDLSRLIHRDCSCRPSPVSPASEAATAACAPADRDAYCPGISGGVLPRADVASVDELVDPETRSEHFATDVAEHRCVALPDGPDDMSAAESACPPTAAAAESSSHWSRKSVIRLFQLGCLLRLVPRGNSDSCRPDTANVQLGLDAPIASHQEAALMPSAAPTLPGNAGGDARVNYLLDPLQGSLTIGDVKLFGDIQALTPKEACYAFDTSAVQLALLAAPDAQPISAQDSLAVGPSCSAEIDQTLVSFMILAAFCVALPVKDGAAVAVYLSGCDPPAVNCFLAGVEFV